jgi:hypothetical protein
MNAWTGVLIAAALMLAAPAAPIAAQDVPPAAGQVYGLGLVAGVPEMMLGLTFHGSGRRPGLYLDFRISLHGPGDDYYENIASWEADRWGDRVTDEFVQNLGLNVGLVTPRLGPVALYGAGGPVMKQHYQERYDPMRILGTGGRYVIDAPEGVAWGVNLMAGALVRAGSNMFVQAGVESMPRGVTLGIGFSFGN